MDLYHNTPEKIVNFFVCRKYHRGDLNSGCCPRTGIPVRWCPSGNAKYLYRDEIMTRSRLTHQLRCTWGDNSLDILFNLFMYTKYNKYIMYLDYSRHNHWGFPNCYFPDHNDIRAKFNSMNKIKNFDRKILSRSDYHDSKCKPAHKGIYK